MDRAGSNQKKPVGRVVPHAAVAPVTRRTRSRIWSKRWPGLHSGVHDLFGRTVSSAICPHMSVGAGESFQVHLQSREHTRDRSVPDLFSWCGPRVYVAGRLHAAGSPCSAGHGCRNSPTKRSAHSGPKWCASMARVGACRSNRLFCSTMTGLTERAKIAASAYGNAKSIQTFK